MGHTTRYGNHYTASEWLEMQDNFADEADENEKWLEAQEELVEKAANYLNREFADVPVDTWINALNNPHLAQFTDSKKEGRYDAAQRWIDAELKKI